MVQCHIQSQLYRTMLEYRRYTPYPQIKLLIDLSSILAQNLALFLSRQDRVVHLIAKQLPQFALVSRDEANSLMLSWLVLLQGYLTIIRRNQLVATAKVQICVRWQATATVGSQRSSLLAPIADGICPSL